MLLLILLSLAAGGVIFVVCTLIVLCCFEAVGNTYRSLPAVIRPSCDRQRSTTTATPRSSTNRSTPSPATVTLRRRSRTEEPYVTGRRAIYLYTAHGPRGAKSNHPERWRSTAAVITVSGADLLDAVGDAKLKYRRHDAALAVLGDYQGPGRVAVRSGNVVKLKNHPTPPGRDPEENHS